jgi:imidazole glycerol-phosphate synthase subunit HisH
VTIAILDYGSGNLHSVARAIARAGGEPALADQPRLVDRADALVIPGVGHFGACIRALDRTGLRSAAVGFIGGGRPVFAVCVGMQVLLEGSEEDAEEGLGLFRGICTRLPEDVKIPHMGWNTLSWKASHPYAAGIGDGERFYFVHSFAPQMEADGVLATTEHGRGFASVISRDNVCATQFHPERSGEAGLRLYANFVREANRR